MSLFNNLGGEEGSSGSIWSHGGNIFTIASPLADILERDSFTLEEILEEDELIQEVKSRNSKLIDYLSLEETVAQMVEYITTPPQDDDSDLRKFKYPFMSCEVICCDIVQITDTLATGKKKGEGNPSILLSLFEILRSKDQIDPRLAGYFEKTVSLLLVRSPVELSRVLNRNSIEILHGFISHISSFSIAELFKRLIQPYQKDIMDEMKDFVATNSSISHSSDWYNYITHDDDEHNEQAELDDEDKKIERELINQNTLLWQQEYKVIQLLVDQLQGGGDGDPDIPKHASEILVDILDNSSSVGDNTFSTLNNEFKEVEDDDGEGEDEGQENDVNGEDDEENVSSMNLVDYIEKKEIIETLINIAVPSESRKSSSCQVSALRILGALLSRYSRAEYSKTMNAEPVPTVISLVLDKFPQIMKTLKGDGGPQFQLEGQRIITQCHKEIPRLGLLRLKLVGLVVLLVQTKHSVVDLAVIENDTLNLVLDLFASFEWVNMLHTEVEALVLMILQRGSFQLQQCLLHDVDLFGRLLALYHRNDTRGEKSGSLGFMGHVYRMSNSLMLLMEEIQSQENEDELDSGHMKNDHKSKKTLEQITQLDNVAELFYTSGKWTEWQEFVSSRLVEINKRSQTTLGEKQTSNGNDGMDDEAFDMSRYHNAPDDDYLMSQFNEMMEMVNNDEGFYPTKLPDDDDDSSSSSSSDDDFTDFDPRLIGDGLSSSDIVVEKNRIDSISNGSTHEQGTLEADWANFDDNNIKFADFTDFDNEQKESSTTATEEITLEGLKISDEE